MATRIEIGDRIRDFRQAKRLSQERLADLAGVRIATVSDWETGKNYPEFAALLKIAEGLGVAIDEILGRQQPKKFSMAPPIEAGEDVAERLGRTVGLLQAALEQALQVLDDQERRLGRLESAQAAPRGRLRKGAEQ